MEVPRFDTLPEEEQDWLDAYLDSTIEAQAFESLQNRMLESPELRRVMRRYLALDNSLQNECGDGDPTSRSASDPWLNPGEKASSPATQNNLVRLPNLVTLATAAAIAFLLGAILMHWKSLPGSDAPSANSDSVEPSARGFAVVSGLYDAAWPDQSVEYREGDTLGAEDFLLASGTAEIQFFSGATMTIEGPAKISLTSAWEAACREGSVRMQVPPAARGFKLHAPSSEIIDLGTEFGLVVRDGVGHVEVFDGEIAIRQQGEAEKLVSKGAAIELKPGSPIKPQKSGIIAFPDVKQFGMRSAEQRRIAFQNWQTHRDTLARDDRLLAYYTFDREDLNAPIPNLTVPPNPEFDGAVVLAESVAGRWPEMKSALEFRRPGARVRVNIPGEFPAFTFVCWVRIDSLDRWYNALFMGDGYETGEPHWQIKNTGQMMLSIMVDDSRPNPGAPNDAGFHRVYYSPPIWDISMSGQWLHLASVFDPAKREVSHYVNGEQIHRQEITEKFFIDKLRIGNGEIGNWGEPFREDPTFAIRNLNGRMDELAIFKVALSPEEISELFKRSRSGQR